MLPVFIGKADGTISCYINNSTNSSIPNSTQWKVRFVAASGAANPLNSINVGGNAAPSWVDLDGDGDQVLRENRIELEES